MHGITGPGGRSGAARPGGWLVVGLVACLTAACSSGLSDASTSTKTGSLGSPVATPPTGKFVPSSKVGTKSPLAHQLGLSLVQVEGPIKQFADATETGAKAADLQTFQAVNGSNSSKAVEQLNAFIQRQVGTMFAQDLNPAAQEPVLKNAINQGIGTFSFNMPASMQMTASQYEVGKQLAHGTLDYIAQHLHNKAKIVHFNFDYNEAVAPRDRGWREVMKTRPAGVQIVADIPGNPQTQEEGNKLMSSILQKDPSVNVVDGSDTLVLGALAALRAAGRGSDPSLALFGVDGDPQAVHEVKSGGPYKATYAFNFAILGSLLSDMSDRWLKGLNIPELVLVPAIKIDSPASIDAYNNSVSDPAAAYKTAGAQYFQLYGNTSYATRGTYFDGTVK